MRRAVLLAGLALLLAPVADARTDRLDRSFAKRGWRTMEVGAYDSGAQAVLRTRAGKVLVGGFAEEPVRFDTQLGFTRLHASGRIDTRFGRRGELRVRAGEYPRLAAMQELPDGRVLAAFESETKVDEFGVVRLTASGKLDRAYGDRGIAWVKLPGAGGYLAGMAIVRGGAATLAMTALVAPGEPRVALVRVSADGRSTKTTLRDLAGAYAMGITRTRGGHLMIAAYRPETAAAPYATILFGAGPFPEPRVIEGAYPEDIVADRRSGVAVLLETGNRWGVRRYSETLVPRKAPARLSSTGDPTSLAIAPGSAAWVGLARGQIARVRADGRPDRRWGRRGRSTSVRSAYLLTADAVASFPGGRVVAAGRAVPPDTGDIREDYGPSRMWVGRFRR